MSKELRKILVVLVLYFSFRLGGDGLTALIAGQYGVGLFFIVFSLIGYNYSYDKLELK